MREAESDSSEDEPRQATKRKRQRAQPAEKVAGSRRVVPRRRKAQQGGSGTEDEGEGEGDGDQDMELEAGEDEGEGGGEDVGGAKENAIEVSAMRFQYASNGGADCKPYQIESSDEESELDIGKKTVAKADMTRDLMTVFTDWQWKTFVEEGSKSKERGRWCLLCK